MKTVESRGLLFGLITTAGLIAFFLIMKEVGLIHNFNLRILNALLLFVGVFASIKSYKNIKQSYFQFLKGAGVGLITSLVSGITFSLFILAYLLLNPSFMEAIKANEPQGIYLNEWAVAVIIFIEATASGFLFSYISMQWLKEKNMADLSDSARLNS